jgi:hypothetical protein
LQWDESAIHQHNAGGRAQWSHNLVAVQIAVASVAHDELVVCIESAPGIDPSPLISVGDRVRKDLLVRLNRGFLVGDRGRVAFAPLSQPLELPLAHADEHNAEHGDEDDQQYPAEPQAAHAARLVCLVVHQQRRGRGSGRAQCRTAADRDPDKESREGRGYPFNLMCGVPS